MNPLKPHRKYIIIHAVVFFLSLAGCEKPITVINPPKADAKLVVICFISPQDEYIVVKLSKSVPVFANNKDQPPELIKDASVIISEGSQHAQCTTFTSDSTGVYYRVKTAILPVIAGR